MASVGSIVGGGFRLIRERPVSVVVWGLVHAVLGVASIAILLPQMGSGGMMTPTPGQLPPNFGSMMGAIFGLDLLVLIVDAILTCAVFRSVLRPEDKSFAALRFGMDELRMIGLWILLGIVGFIAMLILMLLVGLLIAALAFISQGNAMVGGLIAVLVWLGVMAFVIWIWVRLSLVLPLTFLRRKIAIDQGWSLSRGHFWTLFLAYLIIAIMGIVLTIMVIYPFMAGYVGDLIRAAGNPQAMQALQAEQLQRQLDMPMTTRVLMLVLNAAVSAVWMALSGGALATAARELLIENGEVPEDDALRTAAVFD